MARLFFALWPPKTARALLAELGTKLAQDCGGRAVVADKIHLTLAFLGEVDAAGEVRALEVAEAIAFEPFELVLDRVGCFPRAHVAWAAPSAPDPRAGRLAEELAAGLRAAGFALERRAFAAHVTLVRRIVRPCAEAPSESIAWKANAFALVESDSRTGRYVEKASWRGGKAR